MRFSVRYLALALALCCGVPGRAQHALYAASELDTMWSFLYGDKPYSLKLRTVYSDTDHPGQTDTTVIVARGIRDRIQYRMDDDIEVAYASGLMVEVVEAESTIYISEDTFRRPPVSSFGVFKAMEKDSTKYRCNVVELSNGKRKIEYRMPGTQNPYSAFYYSVPSYKPDSAVMELVIDYDPYEDKILNTGVLRIYYDEAGAVDMPHAQDDIGPLNILSKRNGKWVPRTAYSGYALYFEPTLNLNPTK